MRILGVVATPALTGRGGRRGKKSGGVPVLLRCGHDRTVRQAGPKAAA
jgi:hypothetical protein